MVEHQSGMLTEVNEQKGTVVDPNDITLQEDAVVGDEATGEPIDVTQIEYQDDHAGEDIVYKKPEEDITPDLDTEDWLSKLRDDEVFQGPDGPAPRLHGLRRLARPFILSEESRVNALVPIPREIVRTLDTKNGEGHTMSSSEVVGNHYFPMASVTFFVTLLDGRTFSDSADAYFPSIGGEGSKAVGLHPTAVASARAEARTLRKVLGIREHAAEELVEKDAGEELAPDDDSPVKPGQAKLIDKILGELELSLKELLENVTTREIYTVEELTTGEARKALKLLNDLKKKAKRKAPKK